MIKTPGLDFVGRDYMIFYLEVPENAVLIKKAGIKISQV